MCGRFDFHGDLVDIEAAFAAVEQILTLPPPCYNIAPTMPATSLLRQDGKLTLRSLTFGLKRRAGGLWINARSESYRLDPSTTPCAIVVNGFYEWQRRGSVRQPFYVSMLDGSPFALAALRRGDHFVVLTGEPNEQIGQWHARMPIILDAARWRPWIERGEADFSAYPADHMRTHGVSRRVNDVRNDGPECIAADKSA